jgi:hypothetical protein
LHRFDYFRVETGFGPKHENLPAEVDTGFHSEKATFANFNLCFFISAEKKYPPLFEIGANKEVVLVASG